jgi:hypothetical protein
MRSRPPMKGRTTSGMTKLPSSPAYSFSLHFRQLASSGCDFTCDPMCGRISRTSPREVLADEFGVSRFVNVDLRPRYNVAPSENIETIIRVGDEKRLGPNALGFCADGREGSEARFDQRPRRDPLDVSNVPRCVPAPSLPCRRGRVL